MHIIILIPDSKSVKFAYKFLIFFQIFHSRGNTGLVFTFFLAQFDIPYSVLFQGTLSHCSKFNVIGGKSLPTLCFC